MVQTRLQCKKQKNNKHAHKKNLPKCDNFIWIGLSWYWLCPGQTYTDSETYCNSFRSTIYHHTSKTVRIVMGSKTVRILMFPSDVSDRKLHKLSGQLWKSVCVCVGGGGDCGLLLFCCVYLIQDFIKYKQKNTLVVLYVLGGTCLLKAEHRNLFLC